MSKPHVVTSRRFRRRTSFAGVIAALLAAGLALLTEGSADAACRVGMPDLQCLDPITVDGDPIPAPSPQIQDLSQPGTGLCAAFRSTSTAGAKIVFPQRDTAGYPGNAEKFPDDTNGFMDGTPGHTTGMDGPRIDATLRTPFDLSNNISGGGDNPDGDFVDTPACMPITSGCAFPGSTGYDLNAGYGTRFRGYFYVKPEWMGQPLHFGFFADQAVAMRIFANPSKTDSTTAAVKEYLVASHGWDSQNKLRVTNEVIFLKSGLFPVEILNANIQSAGILEVTVLFGNTDFFDIDEEYSPVQDQLSKPVSGKGAGYDRAAFSTLYTQPENFYQTAWARHPFVIPDGSCKPALDRCQQCPRSEADPEDPVRKPKGNNSVSCGLPFYCNAAAVCAPCLTDQHCGPQCQTCTAPTPRCVPSKICPDDAAGATCNECVTNSDCIAGQVCTVNNHCVFPPCCADAPHAIYPDPSNPNVRICSPCELDTDCPDGQHCDARNARCIDQVPMYNTDEMCGKPDVNCKMMQGLPFCLNGTVCVECRADADCGGSRYCESGSCKDCVQDRHCGASCQNCGTQLVLASGAAAPTPIVTDTPYCMKDPVDSNNASKAVCVRCTDDTQCGVGGICDRKTFSCMNQPTQPCDQGLHWDGNKCVECFTSAQCLCGICDVTNGTCTPGCSSNKDCQGNQCCVKTTGKCESGRCDDSAGTLCGCSVGAACGPVVDLANPNSVDIARSRSIGMALLAMLLCGLLFSRGRRWSPQGR